MTTILTILSCGNDKSFSFSIRHINTYHFSNQIEESGRKAYFAGLSFKTGKVKSPKNTKMYDTIAFLLKMSDISFTRDWWKASLPMFHAKPMTTWENIPGLCIRLSHQYGLFCTLLAKKVVTPRDDVCFLWLFPFHQSARSNDRLFGVI